MERKFRKLSNGELVDLIPYMTQCLEKKPDSEILIGCDSQNRKRETIYAIVIVIHRHVLYCRFTEPRYRYEDNDKLDRQRLMNEVWYSVEVADVIKNAGLSKAKWIDIDINPDKRWKSNLVLAEAIGLVTAMGYQVRCKKQGAVVQYAADKLVK